MHFRDIQRLEGASSFVTLVTLGLVTIFDFQFKRTENHNFTNNQYKPLCGILSLLDNILSILAAHRLFYEVVGEKTGFYVNEASMKQ